jgi:hypothetical protein
MSLWFSLRLSAFASCLLLLPEPVARAQGVGFGVTGGINLSEINTSGNELLNVLLTDKVQPVGGVFVTFDTADSFSIQPEFLLSTKGSRVESGSSDQRIRLRYFEFPVLFRYRTPARSTAQFLLFGGPYVARLLDADLDPTRPGQDSDISDGFASFDLGWVVGLGLGVGHGRFELRYSGGLTDIGDSPDLGGAVPLPAGSGSVTFRNRSFVFVGGYRF